MLEKLFLPRSIAVVGASRTAKKVGSMILKNIRNGNFSGQIFPVNPKADKIQGLKTYKSLLDISEDIDIALITVPSVVVPNIVRECVHKGIAFVIIISSGFKETGEEGARREAELAEIIRGSNTRIVGPNCLGIVSNVSQTNATFASSFPKDGSIAFISQSGAFGTAGLDVLSSMGIGVRYFVSLGNKVDLTEIDFLKYFYEDNSINCIAMYLESVSNGPLFKEICSKFSLRKPIIVLKPGISSAAKLAISSHTGSIAGSSEITSTMLKQSGVIETFSMRDLFETSAVFSQHNEQETNIGDIKNTAETKRGVAILTNAGGPAVHCTDELVRRGLSLAELSPKTSEKLKEFLPPAASTKNPVDILGDASPDRYEKTLAVLADDKHVGAVIAILTPQAMSEPNEVAVKLARIAEQVVDKMILSVFIGGGLISGARALLRKSNVPVFEYPGEAVNVLSNISTYRSKISSIRRSKPFLISEDDKFILTKSSAILNSVFKLYSSGRENKTVVVPPQIISQIVSKLAIKMPSEGYPGSKSEAIDLAVSMGYPVVLKIASPKLLHKTEEKAVYVNLKSREEVEAAFDKLFDVAQRTGIWHDGLKINFIQMQSQVMDGIELLIGVKRNEFGHAIVFGRGGTSVELYKDFSSVITPFTDADLVEMVKSTIVYKELVGYRGGDVYNMSDLAKTVIALGKLVQAIPIIKEIDINPFIVTKEKGYAVDVKMVLEETI